jgi:hypothetical protein
MFKTKVNEWIESSMTKLENGIGKYGIPLSWGYLVMNLFLLQLSMS